MRDADEMITVHGREAREPQQAEIDQIALEPTAIADDEIDQCRRQALIASMLVRQLANFVAGAMHQQTFDLVVAEHDAAERRVAREIRQAAMFDIGRDANGRVMPAILASIALPPGCARNRSEERRVGK